MTSSFSCSWENGGVGVGVGGWCAHSVRRESLRQNVVHESKVPAILNNSTQLNSTVELS